jgi:Glycosyl transferase family 2
MSVLIVIPVLDEALSVGRVVTAARAHGPVLVVDDGSHDGSAAAAAAGGAEVLRHPRPLGKAQALLTGVAAARRRGAARVVTLDGDGQHDPDAIPTLLAAADPGERVIVVGNRLDGRGALPAPRRNAVRVASFFAGWTCGQPMSDSQSGFRVYPLALFDEVVTRRGGFVFETEILMAAAARGWAIKEVGVAALPRAVARSHFRPVRDGVAIGAFLGVRVLARWLDEARVVGGELLGVFDSHRMATRHTAMLEAAARYSDSPARWSTAIGAVAVRRAGERLSLVCEAARQRGAPAAALATLVTPVTLPLLLAQALSRDRLPDVVTPLVEAVYGCRTAAAVRGPEPVDLAVGDPVAEGRG